MIVVIFGRYVPAVIVCENSKNVFQKIIDHTKAVSSIEEYKKQARHWLLHHYGYAMATLEDLELHSLRNNTEFLDDMSKLGIKAELID